MLGLGNSLARGGVISGFENTNSLALDGTNDYFVTGSNITVVDASARTVSAWARPTATDGNMYVFSYGDGTNLENFGLWIDTSGSGNIGFVGYDTGDFATTSTVTLNEWQHFVITYNGSTVYVYHNGSSINSAAKSLNTGDSALYIGRKSWSDQNHFEGNIDEVAIWDVALDADAVSAIYNSGTPIALDADDGNYDNSSDLVSWWRMGDGDLDDFNLIADQVNPTLGSEMAGSLNWNNSSSDPYETLTTSGNVVTEADNTSGWGIASTDAFTIASGTIYKVTFNFTLNSGAVPNKVLVASGADVDAAEQLVVTSVSNGLQSHYFAAANSGSTYRFGVRENSATNWSLSDLSIKPVNGNPGLMTNMASDDIVEDTP